MSNEEGTPVLLGHVCDKCRDFRNSESTSFCGHIAHPDLVQSAKQGCALFSLVNVSISEYPELFEPQEALEVGIQSSLDGVGPIDIRVYTQTENLCSFSVYVPNSK
jgi:hypothetical protein